MTPFEFWSLVVGIVIAVGTAILIAQKRTELKLLAKSEPLKPEPPKPVLSDIESCSVDIGDRFLRGKFGPIGPFFCEEIRFKFLIDNKGGKDCSATKVKLKLPNDNLAELDDKISTPSLPQSIEVEHPVKFVIYGFCSKPKELPDGIKLHKSCIHMGQNTIKATIIIEFNNVE